MSDDRETSGSEPRAPQGTEVDERPNDNNKRPLSGRVGGSAQQKRASFGQQRQSTSEQGSWSSQASGEGGARRGSSGSAGRRRRAPAPPRRQTSSMDSAGRRRNETLEPEGQDEESGEENLLPSSNADYERIRNETLLFFLDRLYLASTEGKEARTLHDLSCLFGTREFTREMRQIVSASRNGLKKFLESFPSLFQIEGDKVYLTQLKQETQGAARDYHQEAVDYFRQKLLQFGTSLVPIRNLFGYRSQASQEVRHVSGKNGRDFRRFLKLNEHVFELLADGEHVMLKSALRELEADESPSQASEAAGPEEASSVQALVEASREDSVAMDPYLNKRFAHLIEQCLKRMLELEEHKARPSVPLEDLHERIKLECQNELFLKMVKTMNDLRVLLRMHPKLFRRSRSRDEKSGLERDFVSLVSEDERREMELGLSSMPPQSFQMPARQHSALEASHAAFTKRVGLVADAERAREEQPRKEPSRRDSNSKARNEDKIGPRKNGSRVEESTEPQGAAKQTPGRVASAQVSALARADSSQSAAPLRANAPPFVPHARPQDQPAGAQQVQRSLSNLGPGRGALPQQASQHHEYRRLAPSQPVDPRGAIRNYLTKASPSHHNLHWAGTNSSSSTRVYHATRQQSELVQSQVFGGGPTAPPESSNSGGQQQAARSSAGHATTEAQDLRARTVSIVREASDIITRIMTTTDAVAFDCKGYNLGFDGQITLIQFGFLPSKSSNLVARTFENLTSASGNENADESNNNNKENNPQASPKPEVCVFDLITNPELAYCLKPLLESDKVVKIVHDVRNKSNALYVQFKIILNKVFDTQVANLVIQQQDTGKPAYKSRYISMSKLCEVYGDSNLLKYRNIIKSKTRHAATGGGGASSRLKDVNYWRSRPLTKPMIIESTMDVYCLIGGIYQHLKSKLKPEYEPLFEQLNLEGVLARIKPDEIRSAKKGRKIDLEVIDLKRKLYCDATGPVVLSNREIRLLRHIDLTDEVRQKIQQCKKVAKKLERLDMKAQQMQASQLQSLSSQASEQNGRSNRESEDPHSLGSCSSTGEASLSTATSAPTNGNSSSGEQQLVEDEEILSCSSMFDELKDKMIESSNLLKSIDESLKDVV